MAKRKIWVNLIVHNEDQFVWFAVMSVINFVDKVLIYDTGSTDLTVEIIKDLKKKFDEKIIFKEVGLVNAGEFSRMRQKMLDESKSDWILVLDGDEVWQEDSIKKVIETINKRGQSLDAVVVPFYNLIGDVYHYQPKEAGQYKILGKKGHLTVKAISKRIPGLHIENPYGSEGYFDDSGMEIQKSIKRKLLYLEAPFLHFTHLKRSSVGQTLSKYKYELGVAFTDKFKFPDVLSLPTPGCVPSPWRKRTLGYFLKSLLRQPLIFLWRKIK